ncbi:MAG TPA: hypothetical protein VNH11_11570 [Pirellulales bacterium]|nr:hypothetical protein [Pirellulales bacterium]
MKRYKWLAVVAAALSLGLSATKEGHAQAGAGGAGGAGVAPGAPGGVGAGGAGAGGFGMGAGGAGGAGFGMGAGGAGSGFTGSGVGIGGTQAAPGAHIGTMLPGPLGNTIEQSPGVNGSSLAPGIRSGSLVPGRRLGQPRFGKTPPAGGNGAMGRGKGPVPKGGDPNPAETLLKDMDGTHAGQRSGHAALRPPRRYRRSKGGLSSDPPALAPERIEEQAVYFAKRGAYEDMVYHPYKGSYRQNEATRSARSGRSRGAGAPSRGG